MGGIFEGGAQVGRVEVDQEGFEGAGDLDQALDVGGGLARAQVVFGEQDGERVLQETAFEDKGRVAGQGPGGEILPAFGRHTAVFFDGRS